MIRIAIAWIAFWGACAESEPIVLDNPTDMSSVVAIERSQAAIFVHGETIYQVPDRKSFFVATPFRSDAKTREAMFGDLLDSTRMEIGAEGEKSRPWRGIAAAGEVLMLLDGVTLEVIGYSLKNQAFMSRHSIVWDSVRPPRDRGGEAGAPETRQFRRKFYDAMSKADESKFVGIAAVPDKWRESADYEYFVATRVRDFPLLILRCTKDDPSRCRVHRSCFVSGLKVTSPGDVAGVGVVESKRVVLIGDRKLHGAHVLRYDSCLSVRKQGEVHFPKRVFEISNIHVDAADRLWATSIRPDDYFNATGFYWDIGNRLR